MAEVVALRWHTRRGSWVGGACLPNCQQQRHSRSTVPCHSPAQPAGAPPQQCPAAAAPSQPPLAPVRLPHVPRSAPPGCVGRRGSAGAPAGVPPPHGSRPRRSTAACSRRDPSLRKWVSGNGGPSAECQRLTGGSLLVTAGGQQLHATTLRHRAPPHRRGRTL